MPLYGIYVRYGLDALGVRQIGQQTPGLRGLCEREQKQPAQPTFLRQAQDMAIGTSYCSWGTINIR